MENRKDKVEVIIPQGRYDELLKAEVDLLKLKKDNELCLEVTYMNSISIINTLSDAGDKIRFTYNIGESFPEEIREAIETKVKEIKDNLEILQEYRLNKLDELKTNLSEDFLHYKELSKERKLTSWFNKIMFILRMHKEDIKERDAR